MKNTHSLCLISVIVLSLCLQQELQGAPSEYDLAWTNSMPVDFWDGAFIGDGLQGGLITKDPANANGMRVLLSHNNAYANYVVPDPPVPVGWHANQKVFCGNIIIHPKGTPTYRTMRMRIVDGEVTGDFTTDQGAISWKVISDRKNLAFVAELVGTGGESNAVLGVREEWGVNPVFYHKNLNPSNYPDHVPPRPALSSSGQTNFITNLMKTDGANVIAYTVTSVSTNRQVLFLAIGAADGANTATAAATAKAQASLRLAAALAEGYDAICLRHRQWWNDYMQLSSIKIPNAYWEKFWHIQMYKFACCANGDLAGTIDTQGVWLYKGIWAAVWWNLNIQLAYFPMFSGNRLETGKMYINNLNSVYQSGALHANAVGDGGAPGISIGRAGKPDGNAAWGSEWGNMPWLLQLYWKYYKYSGDDSIGRDLFPMLKDNALFLKSKLTKLGDGKYHFTAQTRSPEYDVSGDDLFADVNYSLMGASWVFKTLLELNRELGMNASPAELANWQEWHDNLLPFPQSPRGYDVAAGVPFDRGHRHYSHLMAIYPYHLLDPSASSGNYSLANTSITNWYSLTLGSGYAGFTFMGAASLFATIGQGTSALNALNQAVSRNLFSTNTMYREAGMTTIETPMSGVESINYMLLQSWNDTIRLYPAVPAAWTNMQFSNLRAQGAFLVSADYHSGMVTNVTIFSEKGKLCAIQSPWTNRAIEVRENDVTPVKLIRNGNIFNFTTKTGTTYSIHCALPPDKPSGLTAEAGPGAGTVRLSWGVVSNATGYLVKRSYTNSGYTVAGSATNTNYTDSIQYLTNYYYAVSATNSMGDQSADSDPVMFSLPLPMPETPAVTNYGASGQTQSSCTLQGLLTTGYFGYASICWGLSDGGPVSTSAWQNVQYIGLAQQGIPFSAVASGLSPNVTYWYRCFVSNASGSAWSQSVADFSGLSFDSTPWTPANITVAAWYDASDSSTITAPGGAVSQWRDKSLNNRHLAQGTSALQPQVSPAAIHGLSGVDFTGDIMGTSGNPFGTTVQNALVLVVHKVEAVQAAGTLFSLTGSDAAANRWNAHAPYYDVVYFDCGGVAAPQRVSGSFGVAAGTVVMSGFYGSVSDSVQSIFRNGALLYSDASGHSVATVGGMTVGGDGTNFQDTTIGEVVVIDGTVSVADRQKLEGYLAHKWGLAGSLPGDHPYKAVPPVKSAIIANLAPGGIGGGAATFNAALSVPLTNYDVYVHYGTSNGSTNPGLWESSAYAGSWTNVASTNISCLVDGLASGQTYYYTFSASNAHTIVWAQPSWAFAVPGLSQMPVITSAGGATDISYTSAVLNGALISTGAAETTVWCCWNPDSDPGPTTTGWACSRSFGVAEGLRSYTNDTSETAPLLQSTVYYYRYCAVNSYGTNWSVPRRFETLRVNTPPVVNAGPDQTVTLGTSQIPWTPAEIACVTWHDASDRATLTTNTSGVVSRWNDKSGSGRHLVQSNTSYQPSCTNKLNGLSVINFDGSDDFMTNTAATVSFSGIQCAFVYRQESGGGAYSGPSKWGSSGVDQLNLRMANTNSTLQLEINSGSGSVYTGNSEPASFGVPAIGGMSWDGATAMVFVNGSNTSSGTTLNGTVDVNTKRIGQSSHKGYVAEMVYVNSTNSVIRQKLDGYLAHKWGLTNSLPAGHPYKRVAPGTATAVVIITGSASDADGDPLTTTWSVVSPTNGVVTFGNAAVTNTTATFTSAGNYVLRLTANDAYTQSVSLVTITVGGSSAVTTNHGVSHAWLDAVSTNVVTDYEAAALADPDGDGFATWQEYWSGTDPQNRNSFLSIASISAEGGIILIKWEGAEVGAWVSPLAIQATTNLLYGSWSNVQRVALANGINAWSNSAAQQLFYRLVVTNGP